jgi:ElaA protein
MPHDPILSIRLVTTAADRAAAFAVRRAVFIEEQGVSEAGEFDGHDGVATHLLAELEGHVAGTLRWRPVDDGAVVKIERVAVLAEARGQRIGEAMMRRRSLQVA